MIQPVRFVRTNTQPDPTPELKIEGGLDFNFFVKNDSGIKADEIPITEIAKSTPKAKKQAKTKRMADGSTIVVSDDNSDSDLPMVFSNENYLNSYEETNSLLRVAITQIDQLSGETKNDLDQIRASKTLKKKYDYIPMMASTLGSLMNTKITAIREINKSISDSHTLELRRAKELKLDANGNQKDDDKMIMDLYNAMINTPYGAQPMHTPSMGELSLLSGQQALLGAMGGSMGEPSMDMYYQNISPTQNAMRYEHNPNVKTVVIYDQSNGRRWFDVINLQTNESIPNVERPDAMFLEDTVLNLNTGRAENSNLDMSWPLIILNQDPTLNMY